MTKSASEVAFPGSIVEVRLLMRSRCCVEPQHNFTVKCARKDIHAG